MVRNLRVSESVLLSVTRTSLAVATLFMATLVMCGWLIKSAAVVQIHPDFAPMQFNTALGFFLVSVALLPHLKKHRFVTASMGAAVLLLAVATLLQYIFHMDFGIDSLIVEPFTTVRTSHPGRMAPNTAICFALSGCAILAYVFEQRTLGGCIGTAVLGSGLVSFFGYASGVEAAYGWGDLTRMAIHTSIGFIGIGLAIGLKALASWHDLLRKPVLTSGAVAVLMFTCTISVWQALVAERDRDLHTELRDMAERSAIFVGYRMTDIFEALERLARRTAHDDTDMAKGHWDLDSVAYLEHMPSLKTLAWFNADDTVWLTARTEGGNSELTSDLKELAAQVRSVGKSDPFQIRFEQFIDGEARELVVAISIGMPSGGDGVFMTRMDVEKAFYPALQGSQPGVYYRIADGSGLLFDSTPKVGISIAERYVVETPLLLFGESLSLTAIATESYVSSQESRAANVVLIAGLLLVSLLIVTIQLGLFGWRTREAYSQEYSRYQLVAKHVPAMIAAFDEKELLIFASPPFLEWLDKDDEATLLGQPATMVFGNHFDGIKAQFRAAFEGVYVKFDWEIEPEGSCRQCFDVQIVPHTDQEGGVIAVYTLMRDTTDETLANLRLEETAEQLNRFSQLAIGREETMIGLKKEINELLESAGKKRRYKIAGVDDIDAGTLS